ncbi:MAG: AbiV family abortive infection protein [Sediminibacterium sp.]|nr:AbiV family abortive infection protein [Sediminibacterium sp.]
MDFYKEGYDLTVANVRSLMRVSNKAAETDDFGIACALNILAAEEALKALFLIIKNYNPESNINNFDKIFRFHAIKHDELKQIIIFQDVIQAKNREFLNVLELVLRDINKMTEDYKIRNLEIINSLNDDYIWFKQQSERSFDLDNILKWLRDANNDKNKGLYVDKLNNKWISPFGVTKEKFEIEKHFTQSIFDHVLNLEEVFKRGEKTKNLR